MVCRLPASANGAEQKAEGGAGFVGCGWVVLWPCNGAESCEPVQPVTSSQ